MPIPWTAALRLYSKQNGHFILPKKGSPQYEAVRKIQQETDMTPEHAVKKREKKGNPKSASKVAFANPGGESEALHVGIDKPAPGIVPGKIPKGRAPTKYPGAEASLTESGNPILPPPSNLTQIDNQGVAEKSKEVVNPSSKPVRAVKKGVSKTGKTNAANAANEIMNESTGMSAVVSAQLPDQKKEIEKALKKNKKTPADVVHVGDGSEKTIDGLKSDDPKAIEGKAPFSIQALRNKLLC